MNMTSEAWNYLGFILLSTVKFGLGLIATAAMPNFTFIDLVCTAGLGGFIGVLFFSFFGEALSKLIETKFPKKPKSFKKRRRIYKIWGKFGLPGVAFLIPLISPPVSIGIAIAFGEKRAKIIFYMSISILCWTLLVALFREQALAWFG